MELGESLELLVLEDIFGFDFDSSFYNILFVLLNRVSILFLLIIKFEMLSIARENSIFLNLVFVNLTCFFIFFFGFILLL